MKEGAPHTQAAPGTAAEFIVQDGAQVSGRSGSMGWWAVDQFCPGAKARPRSRHARQRIRHDGRRIYADKGAIDPGAIDARREFNWWFDPEATRIVLRAPWKKVTITPIDISVKTRFTAEMKSVISKANTPVTQYLDKYSLPGYMWDEIAGAALIDPSIITGQKQLYVDIDLDRGASYGKTIFWDFHRSRPSVPALGQCPIRYRRSEVLQNLYRLDDPTGAECPTRRAPRESNIVLTS